MFRELLKGAWIDPRAQSGFKNNIAWPDSKTGDKNPASSNQLFGPFFSFPESTQATEEGDGKVSQFGPLVQLNIVRGGFWVEDADALNLHTHRPT